MTDTYPDLDDPGWLHLFEDLSRSWFRLETLQTYAVDYEDKEQADFHRTGVLDDTTTPWRQMIRRHTEAGRSLQRVHVVEEPLTEYLRYELAVYALNSAVGEDIGLIPVTSGEWPEELPRSTDFWLFDDEEVWDMHYDEAGHFLAATRSDDAAHIEDCLRWRKAALLRATPLDRYSVSIN